MADAIVTDITAVIIVAAIAPTIAAIGAIIVSLINRKKNKADLEDAKKGIHQIHLEINSRMTQLLELSQRSAHAEGKEEERTDEVARKIVIEKNK